MSGAGLTPLQRKLCSAKALKRAICGYIETEQGIPAAGLKRIIYRSIKQGFIARLTDNQIRDILYYALQCTDITQEERQQIEKLLDLR